MPTPSAIIPNRIDDLLKERNMTAYALAKQLGRNRNVISRVINGERGASDRLKKQISDALGLPVHKVFLYE